VNVFPPSTDLKTLGKMELSEPTAKIVEGFVGSNAIAGIEGLNGIEGPESSFTYLKVFHHH